MPVTSQNRKYYWLSQRLTCSPFPSFSPICVFFYSITLYHFHLLPYFCWLWLVARATCARKHINLIATICSASPALRSFLFHIFPPTLDYLVFLARSRLISYVSGANGKTQLGWVALISYLQRVSLHPLLPAISALLPVNFRFRSRFLSTLEADTHRHTHTRTVRQGRPSYASLELAIKFRHSFKSNN